MAEKQKSKMPKPMKIITSILCVILGLILISNVTIIIKGTLNPDRPPSVFGVTSMIVLSGSMSGEAPDHIEVGDLVITKSVNPNDLKVGDIITFMENGTTTVTHRIMAINEDGTFTTKGDANNAEDTIPVTSFEGMEIDDIRLFNALTGSAVCIIVLILGINLLRKGTKND